MVYKDVLITYVREMHRVVVPMRDVKLKFYAFGGILCL